MNPEDKHKNWALEPDTPTEEPVARPEPGRRAARRKRCRWPVFGLLSWLAIPVAVGVWFLTAALFDGVGWSLALLAVFVLLLGVSVCFSLGALFGVIGVRRSEPWWGIAFFGVILNVVPLALSLYGVVMLVILFVEMFFKRLVS